MRFDFHKYQTFRECPRKYHYQVTNHPVPVPDNKYYAVYGQLVQKFFELYANRHVPEKIPLDFNGISQYLRPFFDHILKYSYVDWGAPASKLSQSDFFDDAVRLIVQNLQRLDLYREGTRSELKIEVVLKSNDVLVSKIDFEKTYPDGSIALLDGKTTGQLGKNVDAGQLLFYAGMYQAQFRRLPDELAFVYYKLFVKETIAFDVGDVRALVQDVVGTLATAKATTVFKPTPCAKACRYCSWVTVCPEGKADMESRKRGPRKRVDVGIPPGMEDQDYLDISAL